MQYRRNLFQSLLNVLHDKMKMFFQAEMLLPRGDVKMSMSDKKLNFLSFLFDSPSPPPFKTKVTKSLKVSVNTRDIDSIKTKIKNKANLTTYIVEKRI